MTDALAWIGIIGGSLGVASTIYTAARVKDIERFRAQLHAEGFEHETRFARLQERRVEVIADIYSKLVTAEASFASWSRILQLAGEPTPAEKKQLAMDAFNEFHSAFIDSRIWIDVSIAEQLAAVDKKLYNVFIKFTTYSEGTDEHRKAWMEAWESVRSDIPPLREEIEHRFRIMLGVTRVDPETTK